MEYPFALDDLGKNLARIKPTLKSHKHYMILHCSEVLMAYYANLAKRLGTLTKICMKCHLYILTRTFIKKLLATSVCLL